MLYGHPESQVNDLFRPPLHPPGDRRHKGNRRPASGQQPQRTGQDRLRTPELVQSQGSIPQGCRPQGIGATRGVWHPATSAQAQHHCRKKVFHRPYGGFRSRGGDTGKLSDLEPLSLVIADTDGDRTLWRELVDRHHYLGCPRPFGSSLYWFVVDARGRRLGCLLMEAGSRQLPARDDWIGWNERQRGQRLHLVVQNSRFLILPWVGGGNLASRILSMATGQLAGEWERLHQCLS